MRKEVALHNSENARLFTLDCYDHVLKPRALASEWSRLFHMRSQPTYLEVLFAYDRLMSPYFSDKIILNKVVTEAWRFEMLVYCLDLYDQRNHDDPRSGLTVTNLERVCADMDCASPGRVRAILGLMRLGGYLRRTRSQDDSRIVQLEPTAHFIDIVEGWNNRIFQISDAAFPEDKLAESHNSNAQLGWEMRHRGCESLKQGWKLLDPFPEVLHFVGSDGGWMLLLHCTAKALKPSGGKYIEPVSVDLKEFGARFGVSRSHLRRLLEGAYDIGLLLEPAKNGSNINLSKELVASYLSCMAAEISFYRNHGLDGRRELAGPPGTMTSLNKHRAGMKW